MNPYPPSQHVLSKVHVTANCAWSSCSAMLGTGAQSGGRQNPVSRHLPYSVGNMMTKVLAACPNTKRSLREAMRCLREAMRSLREAMRPVWRTEGEERAGWRREEGHMGNRGRCAQDLSLAGAQWCGRTTWSSWCSRGWCARGQDMAGEAAAQIKGPWGCLRSVNVWVWASGDPRVSCEFQTNHPGDRGRRAPAAGNKKEENQCGGPVAGTSNSLCRGPGFNSWSGN